MKGSSLRIGAVAVVLSLSGGSVAQAQDAGTGEEGAVAVVPADQVPLGVPYGEWAARWWQWFASTPAAEHPSEIDNCGAGQGGDVFFIPHVAPGVTKETSCSVGADQPILASGGNTFCDTVGGWGETEEELRSCVDTDKPVFSNVSVTVDGQAVPDIEAFWVVSPLFDVTVPEGNILGYDAGTTTQAVTGGWYVMLEPLAPGSHTVVVHDDIDIPDDDDGPMPAELVANVEVAEAAG